MRRDPAKAIAVLDAMLEFFDGGKRWMRGQLQDGQGNRCLVGALQYARSDSRVRGDGTAELLHSLIPAHQRQRFAHATPRSLFLLMVFNDTCKDYRAVRRLIVRARRIALAELDKAAHERSFQSRSIRQPRVEGRVSGDPRHPMHDATRSDASERSHPGDPVHAA